MSYVSHLECSACGRRENHLELQNLCPECRKPLLVRYAVDRVREAVTPGDFSSRPSDMWRYLEMMPVDSRSEVVGLGEGWTPLVPMPALGRRFEVAALYTKEEALNPTGSFKARGLSAAVTLASKLGARKLAIPSAGNAGGALAAYAAHAGLESYVYVPVDTPDANILETELTATRVELVEGDITDAARLMSSEMEEEGFFEVSTLKEPYRLEGKKTLGYELAEQFGWELPDVVLYPTGGGTGLIGMWKAFDEMEELGWIDSKRPRLVAVQSQGCAPIVRAFAAGGSECQPWPDPKTFASGIRVPRAVGDFLMLRAIRETEGTAIAVSEEEIYRALTTVARSEGIFYCPEGAACWAAFEQLRRQDWIGPADRVVVFNTAAGHKYVDAIRAFVPA